MDKHCNEILEKHWPQVPIFKKVEKVDIHSTEPYEIDNFVMMDKDDIEKQPTTEDWEPDAFYHGEIDVLTGGFPCQDISIGGKQKGLKDKDGKPTERSGLWFEYCRLIEEIRPRYAIIENVERLRKNGLGIVLHDLAKIGYDAEWHCITADSVGLPHQRDRLFIIAYPCGKRQNGNFGQRGHLQADQERTNKSSQEIGEGCESESSEVCQILSTREIDDIRDTHSNERAAVSKLRRVTDGIPEGLDEKARKERVKQLGNAIVPHIAEMIGRRILEIESFGGISKLEDHG